MGFRQSLYNGTRSFLKDSESAAQWAPAVGTGLAIGAGYGMLNGIVSDNTSVFGGTVGGGVFGSGIGAGFAYAVHANKGIRNAARDLSHAALGVNKTVRRQIGTDLDALKNNGLDSDANIFDTLSAYKNRIDDLDGLSGINTDFLRGSGFSKIHKDDVIYASRRVFEDTMNESGVSTKGRVDAARKLFEEWS